MCPKIRQRIIVLLRFWYGFCATALLGILYYYLQLVTIYFYLQRVGGKIIDLLDSPLVLCLGEVTRIYCLTEAVKGENISASGSLFEAVMMETLLEPKYLGLKNGRAALQAVVIGRHCIVQIC